MPAAALRKRHTGLCISAVVFLVLSAAGAALAADESSGKGEGGTEQRHHFFVELKREATNRGTPGETTKTQIKIDTFLDRIVSLLHRQEGYWVSFSMPPCK